MDVKPDSNAKQYGETLVRANASLRIELDNRREERDAARRAHANEMKQTAELRAELATARAEAERQYEENVSQIANYAALEAELDAARRQIEGMQRATNEE